MRGFVLRGTTTVQGRFRVREAWTAARPALPPLELKMWALDLADGGSSERRHWMKWPTPLLGSVRWAFALVWHGMAGRKLSLGKMMLFMVWELGRKVLT
jgi:hypothetical protein